MPQGNILLGKAEKLPDISLTLCLFIRCMLAAWK